MNEQKDDRPANDSPISPAFMRGLRNCIPSCSAAASLLGPSSCLDDLDLPDPNQLRISHEMTPLISAVLSLKYDLICRLLEYKFVLSEFTFGGYKVWGATAYTADLFFNKHHSPELADEAGPPLLYERIAFPLRPRQAVFACQMGGFGDEEYLAVWENKPLPVFTDETDFTGATLLMRACEWFSGPEVLRELLFQAGRANSSGKTAIELAIILNNQIAVDALILCPQETRGVQNASRLVGACGSGI